MYHNIENYQQKDNNKRAVLEVVYPKKLNQRILSIVFNRGRLSEWMDLSVYR